MASTVASPEILLKRILSLRESTPFFLALDTVNQVHKPLTDEFISLARQQNPSLPVTFVSFETASTCKPAYLNESDIFVKLYDNKATVQEVASRLSGASTKNLIIVDSFNYINKKDVLTFLSVLSNPHNVLYGVYHVDVPPTESREPSILSHLDFLCSVILDVKHLNISESDYFSHLDSPVFPLHASMAQFLIDLTYRRKSGRELKYSYKIDTQKHEYTHQTEEEPENPEDESLLEGLTTFNLTTNDKQKKQREKVDLPFMEAQTALGSVGSAIVYTFEKDDDYDEEDPYEDPF